MAIILPNYLQTGSYSAKKDRRVNSAAIMQEGIVHKGHLALAQRAAGANMSVDVAPGEAWVKGDSAIDQGYYHVVNDATVNVPLSAANASNPRIDAIVLAVNDSTEIGGADSYLLEAIAGTATAGATLANLKGAPNGVAGPAIGPTKLLLGYVLVAAAATKVETAAMGGLRDPHVFAADWGMTKVEPYAVAGAPPQYAHGRPLAYVPGEISSAPTPQALAASETQMNFPVTSYNPDGAWENSAYRAKTPGMYIVTAHMFFSTASASNEVRIKLTGGIGGGNPGTSNGAALAYQLSTEHVRVGYGDAIYVVGVGPGATSFTGHRYVTWQGP